MFKLTIVAALVAAVAAQTTTYQTLQTSVPGEPATTNTTILACEATYNTCLEQTNANPSECASSYSGCLGCDPFGPIDACPSPFTMVSGGSSTSAVAAQTTTSQTLQTSSPGEPATTNATILACEATYNTCLKQTNANPSECASAYSGCLGCDPFGPIDACPSPFTLVSGGSSTSAEPTEIVYTTAVVTDYTTYCPYATTVVQNNQTYVVTSATTLTITNCPCTITTPVAPITTTPVTITPVISVPGPSGVITVTSAGPTNYTITGTQTPSPSILTGGADKVVGGVWAGAVVALLGFAAYL